MKLAAKALLSSTLLLFAASAAFAAAPVVVTIPDFSLNVGTVTTVNVVAYDADGDNITLTSNLPSWAVLNAPLSGDGLVSTTLTLNPLAGDVGTATYSVTATAGGETDVESFVITVNASGSDLGPLVTAPAAETVNEGSTLTFVVTSTDTENITSLAAAPLPAGATFTTNASYTSGTFTWTPNSAQAGDYDVTFTASNSLSGFATTHIHVSEVGSNQCPTLTVVPSTLTVVEGQAFAFNISASDPDGGSVDLSATGVPTGAVFVDHDNNTGTLTWTPSSTQAGTYTVTFTANDNEGCTPTATLTITVNEGTGNQCPTVTAPGTRTVAEGQALNFTVTATDPDGGSVTLSATGVPSGATFNTTTGAFDWTPNSTQSGTYTVTFTGNDNEGCAPTATTVITVTEPGANQCPTITAPATRTVNEGQALNFTVTTSDPDGGTLTVTGTNVPSGATFNTSTGAFSWTPSSSQSGTYTVTFTVNDNQGCTQTASTVITVNDVTGGGGTDATAKMLGAYNTHRKFLCFKIMPVNGSFDIRNTDLTSIQLSFNGTTIDAMSGRTHLDWDCDDDGDEDGEDCGDCDHEEDDCPSDTTGCTVSLHTCFSMSSIRDLFGDQDIPSNLANVTITGDLTGGGTFTATMGPIKVAGNSGDKGKGQEKHSLKAKATPNPLNPSTKLTFTLSKAGRVRVLVYDARGRYVKTLLDATRTIGEQSVTWDGSDSRSRKVSSGVYLFRIVAPEAEDIQRVTVLK